MLVAALVPLLKGALLKEGSADELAASSTADDSAGEGAFELGASPMDEAFAGGGFAVCLALADVAMQSKSKSYHGDGYGSLGNRDGYLRRA